MAITLEEVVDSPFEQGQTPDILPLATVADSIQIAERKHGRHGYTWLNIVTMADGTVYEVLTGQPEHQTTDTPVVFTTSWFTSFDGHNSRTLMHMLDAGFPTILVGPEGGHSHSEQPQTYSLGQTAHNMLGILNHTANQNPYSISDDEMLVIGESRGAMVGFGLVAHSPLYGREVKYADLIAPCFPEAFELGKALNYLRRPHLDAVAIASFVGHLSLGRLVHYPQSLNPNPHFLKHAWAARKAIFSGEAGDLARLVPQDAQMHVEVFMDDIAGQGEVWKEIFTNYPDVTVTEVPGSHFSIALPETLYRQEARIKNLLLKQSAPGT